MRDWSAVLFDLDGTLADTVALIQKSFRHAWAAHRDDPCPEAEWLATIGRPLREQLADFTADPAEVETLASAYAAFQSTIHDEMVKPFPGAVDVVAALRASGTKVGVVTSKRRRMAKRTLGVCGLEGAFHILVGADDVSRGKPDPEPVHLALDQLGLTDRPGDVLFVGDAPYDVLAGREAGVRTAAVEWGTYPRHVLEAAGPDYWLRDLRELLTPGDGGSG